MNKLIWGFIILASSSTFAMDCRFYTCKNARCDSEVSRTFFGEITEGINHFRYQPKNSDFKSSVTILLTSGDYNLNFSISQNFETHSFSAPKSTYETPLRYVFNDSMGGKIADYSIECR